MDKFDRIFDLHKIFISRRTPISVNDLHNKLECGISTVKRIIGAMRLYLGAPIRYDSHRNGYYYDNTNGETYELPGLWFNAEEAYALLTTYQLLEQLSPGLLAQELAPFKDRLEALLQHRRLGASEIGRRVRVLASTARPVDMDKFRRVADALMRRKRLRILYHSRSRDETTERIISPQRLIYYRDNWHLDAWCHLRRALRNFSLDRLEPRMPLDQPAREIDDKKMDAYFADAYGIFSGKAGKTAVLRFTPGAAKWVADEHWHPRQKSRVLPDGGLELHIPYGNPTELIGDILRHGPEVEVLAPKSLRNTVTKRLKTALSRYVPEPRGGIQGKNGV